MHYQASVGSVRQDMKRKDLVRHNDISPSITVNRRFNQPATWTCPELPATIPLKPTTGFDYRQLLAVEDQRPEPVCETLPDASISDADAWRPWRSPRRRPHRRPPPRPGRR